MMRRRCFLGCLAVVILGGSGVVAQEGDGVIFQMTRTLGFRPAGMMNVQSDYSFQLKDDGSYSYQSWASLDNEPYGLSGKLPGAIEDWEAQLQKLGLNDIPAPDPNEPILADAPEVVVNRIVDGERWSRTLEVSSPIGKDLHRMVQRLVMGVVQLDLAGTELNEVAPREIKEPLVIESAEALQKLFKAGADSVLNQVDFDKQQVLVWRWDGSGRDSLVAWRSGKGEDAGISYGLQRGMTRDLRQHMVLLAVPKGQMPTFVDLPPAGIGGR